MLRTNQSDLSCPLLTDEVKLYNDIIREVAALSFMH